MSQESSGLFCFLRGRFLERLYYLIWYNTDLTVKTFAANSILFASRFGTSKLVTILG